jgi:hypothetical protein
MIAIALPVIYEEGRERRMRKCREARTKRTGREGGVLTTLLQPSYNPPTTLLQPKTQAPVCSQVWFSKKFAQQHAICHVLDQRLVTGAVLEADGVANLGRQAA